MTPRYEHLGGSQYRAWFGSEYIDIEETRERSYPGLAHGELHSPLYLLAASEIPNESRVLDFSCGSGYGTAILERAYHIATGVDPSDVAVRFARKAFGGVGVDFWRFDATDLIHTNGPRWRNFDAVVSVETIEHADDDREFLVACAAVLKPKGTLFLSTPRFDPERTKSPYHVREYTEAELNTLLDDAGFAVLERFRVPGFEAETQALLAILQ